MRRNRRAEGIQIIPPFQSRDDAPGAIFIGHIAKPPGDPGEILDVPHQVRQRIVAMRVETGGNQDQLGAELFQPGDKPVFNDLAHRLSPRSGRQGQVQNIVRPAPFLRRTGAGI